MNPTEIQNVSWFARHPVLSIIIAICLVILVFVAIVFAIVFKATAAPTRAAKDFLDFIVAENIDQAYAGASESFKNSVNLESFKTDITSATSPLKNVTDVRVVGRQIENGKASINFFTTNSQGQKAYVSVGLRKFNGNWQVVDLLMDERE
jgi:hypothetical protein